MSKIFIRPYMTADRQSCHQIFRSNLPEYFTPDEAADYLRWRDGQELTAETEGWRFLRSKSRLRSWEGHSGRSRLDTERLDFNRNVAGFHPYSCNFNRDIGDFDHDIVNIVDKVGNVDAEVAPVAIEFGNVRNEVGDVVTEIGVFFNDIAAVANEVRLPGFLRGVRQAWSREAPSV